MNLVHLKYAVEVAETGSINKASEKLYVSQPNLSRAIKELEKNCVAEELLCGIEHPLGNPK